MTLTEQVTREMNAKIEFPRIVTVIGKAKILRWHDRGLSIPQIADLLIEDVDG